MFLNVVNWVLILISYSTRDKPCPTRGTSYHTVRMTVPLNYVINMFFKYWYYNTVLFSLLKNTSHFFGNRLMAFPLISMWKDDVTTCISRQHCICAANTMMEVWMLMFVHNCQSPFSIVFILKYIFKNEQSIDIKCYLLNWVQKLQSSTLPRIDWYSCGMQLCTMQKCSVTFFLDPSFLLP